MPRTILILSSMPRDMAPLRVYEEVRAIEDAIRRARHRDEYQVVVRLGARALDVHRALLEYRPAIVHFSGHGYGEQGVVLEDEHGHSLPIAGDVLAELLALVGRSQIECLLLNACHADKPLNRIARHIPFVIGAKHTVDDRAAIVFASAFYEGLGHGESIPFCYELGCNAVRMSGLTVEQFAVLVQTPASRASDDRIRSVDESSYRFFDASSRLPSCMAPEAARVFEEAKDPARDAVRRELPKLLATLFDDPVPILSRAGLPREICRGDSPRSKWSYVCAWLVEQALWGVVYTLRLVDEAQEERFCHEVSSWAANYIRIVSGKHDVLAEGAYGTRGSEEILSFACHERSRWDRYARSLE